MGGFRTTGLAICHDRLCKIKHMPLLEKKEVKCHKESYRSVPEDWGMQGGCNAVQQKDSSEVLEREIFRRRIFCAQQCWENEKNRWSACESACYSFITKRRALQTPSVQGRLIVLQLKSLFYLSQQFQHTYRLTDKQQPMISPTGI